ncbi:hypothetical protein MTO96_017800 [Rhipicephalus appendiculatus]
MAGEGSRQERGATADRDEDVPPKTLCFLLARLWTCAPNLSGESESHEPVNDVVLFWRCSRPLKVVGGRHRAGACPSVPPLFFLSPLGHRGEDREGAVYLPFSPRQPPSLYTMRASTLALSSVVRSYMCILHPQRWQKVKEVAF